MVTQIGPTTWTATDRSTRVILRFMAYQKTPVGVDMVAQAKGVSGKCDPATIYRTLKRLAKLGLPRQISPDVVRTGFLA